MFLRQVWTITAKDLHSELRTKDAWNASIAFSVVILLLFSFAFDPSSDQVREFSGGLLWMTYAFAGALVLNRSFAREMQNDCLDALIASPVSSAALFVGKALANFALLFAVELVSLPVFVLFYNLQWGAAQVGPMLLVLMLGTWALTVLDGSGPGMVLLPFCDLVVQRQGYRAPWCSSVHWGHRHRLDRLGRWLAPSVSVLSSYTNQTHGSTGATRLPTVPAAQHAPRLWWG